jgi:hypothetical protein
MNLNYLRWQIKRFSNVHSQGNQKNIFVFSTARSGSSWLMEMLATQPGMKYINEPLLMTQFEDSWWSPLPPSWELVLPNPERKKILHKYFSALISNDIGVGAPAPFKKFHRWTSNRIVFKILRCKDLMNWFETEFDAQIVYLIRHPIATSISRTSVSRLPMFLANEVFCSRYLSVDQRRFCMAILDHGSELEKKVLDWALQNLPPLRYLDRTNWCCVTYEELVATPESEIAKLSKRLELPDTERVMCQIGVPSGSVSLSDESTQKYLRESVGESDRTHLLRKWRKKVSDVDERRVFEILEHLDIDLYEVGSDLPVKTL